MGLRTFILRLSFVTYSAVPARCEPHWLLSFAEPSVGEILQFKKISSNVILKIFFCFFLS